LFWTFGETSVWEVGVIASEEVTVRELVVLATYILAAMGLTILIVWSEDGPGAFVREQVLRKFLPTAAHRVLDCYICFGFWTGLVLSIPWWFMYHEKWVWFGCLIVPALFWLVIMEKWK